jgi:hypothetical protein
MKGYYMHKDCADVFIQVVKMAYRGPRYSKIKVIWWNLGYTGNPWMVPSRAMSGIETIKINNDKLKDWVQLTCEQFVTPRLKPGLPA